MRSNLQIKVGTYTGNGASGTNITGVGFRPDLVIIKGGANIAVWRTKCNSGDSTMYFAGNTANETDNIKEILNDGFQLGANAKVNANGTVYYYIAIKGTAAQKYFRCGMYRGNNTDNRDLNVSGINFTPDIFFTKGDTAQNPCVRTAEVVGDNSWHFSGTADTTNEIQSMITNGVNLGNSSRTNGATTILYYFAAFKKLGGAIACGTYTGNAVDDREITGLGFKPDFVIVKNGTTTNAAVLRTSDFADGNSASVGAAGPTTDLIQRFLNDGFQIGTNASVNGDTNTFWWFAFKAGSFNAPVERLTS